jgi:hypothetical protein
MMVGSYSTTPQIEKPDFRLPKCFFFGNREPPPTPVMYSAVTLQLQQKMTAHSHSSATALSDLAGDPSHIRGARARAVFAMGPGYRSCCSWSSREAGCRFLQPLSACHVFPGAG